MLHKITWHMLYNITWNTLYNMTWHMLYNITWHTLNNMTWHMLYNITWHMLFGDVLVTKQAFLGNINMYLKRRQNWHFCKGDSPRFWSKSWSFFNFRVSQEIDRKKVFADVLDKKEAFQDYKNNCLRKTQN